MTSYDNENLSFVMSLPTMSLGDRFCHWEIDSVIAQKVEEVGGLTPAGWKMLVRICAQLWLALGVSFVCVLVTVHGCIYKTTDSNLLTSDHCSPNCFAAALASFW